MIYWIYYMFYKYMQKSQLFRSFHLRWFVFGTLPSGCVTRSSSKGACPFPCSEPWFAKRVNSGGKGVIQLMEEISYMGIVSEAMNPTESTSRSHQLHVLTIISYCWWFRNPAFTSWGWQFIHSFTGFYTSLVVQDFWTINSIMASQPTPVFLTIVVPLRPY